MQITLSDAEAYVLYECLAKIDDVNDQLPAGVIDDADQIVLWKIEGALESLLVDPSDPEYLHTLSRSKKEVIDKSRQ